MTRKRRTKIAGAHRASQQAASRRGDGESIWPRVWLAAVTALMVATPMIPTIPGESHTNMGTGVVLSMGWFILLLGWAMTQLISPKPEIRWDTTSLAVGALVGCHVLSGAVMTWQGQPRAVVNSVWQWVSFGTAFFLVRQVVRRQVECRAFTAVMLSLAVYVSVHGYYQYTVGMPFVRAVYEQDPAAAMESTGLSTDESSAEWANFRARLYSNEPFAAFSLANSLAGFLSPWILLAVAISFAAVRQPLQRKTVGAGCLTALLLGGCWLLTQSRTAWLATASGCGLLVLFGRARGWRPDRRLLAAGVGTLVLLVAALTIAGGLDRLILTQSQKSVSYRLEYWQSTVAMIRDHFWLGCGPGNFKQFYSEYKLPSASETIADPHNFLLEIWATTGTLGLLALVGVMVTFTWQLAAGTTEQRPDTTDSFESVRDTDESVWFVYGGGFAGVLLAYPAGLLVDFMPDWEVLKWGLPAAAVVLACWHSWVRDGRLSPALLACAALTLLINLLAAGGISQPGVAMSLWLLIALALSISQGANWVSPLTRRASWGVLGFAALVAAMMYATAYRPVLESRKHIADAKELLREARFAAAEKEFMAASESDRLASLPWQSVADLRHRRWLRSRSADDLADFVAAADTMIDRNRRSYTTRQHYAALWQAAFRATGEAQYLEEAIDCYRQTLTLYPSYNRGYAQLAWALHLAGRKEPASEAAARALELDSVNPHVEQKLRRYRLEDPGPPLVGTTPTGVQPAGPAGRTAEQWMRALRTPDEEPAE